MSIFLKFDELQKKYGNIAIDKMISEEMKEYDIEYEYENETEFIKINFLTEEIKIDRKSKEDLLKKLREEYSDDSLINSLGENVKEYFF